MPSPEPPRRRAGRCHISRPIAAIALSVLGVRDASAIIWNGTDHPERGVTSANGLTDRPGPWANVLVVNNTSNSTRGTATYLGNGWIITARHVVQAGSDYGVLAAPATINFNGFSGTQILAAPSSAEMVLVKLNGLPALPGIAKSLIYTGGAETNAIVAMGGYGYFGTVGGTTSNAANFHRGYNIDYVGGGAVNTILDGEARLNTLGLLETGAMPGDSGSPTFLLSDAAAQSGDWSQAQLAGILATSQGNYWGAQSSYTRVSSFASFVVNTVYTGNTYYWSRGIAGTFSWNNSTLNGDVTSGNNWNSALTPNFPSAAGDVANVGSAAGANNQTLNLDQNITIGSMSIGSTNGTGVQTVAAGGAFTLTFDNLANDASITHNATGRADVVSAPITVAGTGTLVLTNNSTLPLTLSGGVRSGLASGPGFLVNASGANVVSGALNNSRNGGTLGVRVDAGQLTLSAANFHSSGTTVNGGTLVLAAPAAVGLGNLTVNAGTARLAIGPAAAEKVYGAFTLGANALLDVADGGLVLSQATGATEAAAAARIKAGRGGGNWLGANGITSATAAATPGYALGLADNAALGLTQWRGQVVTADSLLIGYTRVGDATLDGVVGFDDLLALAQTYGATQGAKWSRGDFDYSGTVDFDDLLALAQNYGAPASFAADWALAQSLVPEPTTLLALAPLALRRRRR